MPAPAGIQGVWGLVYPLMVRQAHHERGTPSVFLRSTATKNPKAFHL